MNVKFQRITSYTWNFQNFTCVITILVKFDIHSLGFPNFLWCYYRWFITSLAFEQGKKECNILEIILVQGFCPLKIKITQFPGGFFLDMIFLHFIFRPLPEASQCLVRDNDNIITTCTILLIKNKPIILFIAVIKRLGPGISLGYYKHAPPGFL